MKVILIKINIETYNIESNKIKKNFTICLIADIHNTKYSNIKNWNILIEKIKGINPDYILIAGDMIITADDLFDKNSEYKLNYLLSNLADIATVFITYGNHELKSGKRHSVDEIDNYFLKYKNDNRIHFINNYYHQINGINIFGVNPIYESYYLKYKKNWEKYLADALLELFEQYGDDLENLNIMIIHSPEIICNFETYLDSIINNNRNSIDKLRKLKEKLQSIDLFVSGHMHDGLIPKHWQKLGIVKNYGGVVASEGDKITLPSLRFSNICRGIHNVFNGKLIITGGITKWSNPNIVFRTINKSFESDISVIKLLKKKK